MKPIPRQIGTIDNYYGGLHVKREKNLFYWAIENYNGYRWEEIPEYLFQALFRFDATRPE